MTNKHKEPTCICGCCFPSPPGSLCGGMKEVESKDDGWFINKPLRNWWKSRLRRIDCECLLPQIIDKADTVSNAFKAWEIHCKSSPHWEGHDAEAIENFGMCAAVVGALKSGKPTILHMKIDPEAC